MVGNAGSATGIVHADVTLTRSNVKVKVTGLLNCQQLAKPCMLVAMTTAPFRGFIRSSSYVHKKFFSDFHLIWCMGRPRPRMRTSVTLTPSKVKVKVTELPKLPVQFSRSISSAFSVWSSKLMLGGHSMGPGLQLLGARFLNFLLGKLSRKFTLRPMSIFYEIQTAIFR